MIYKSDQSIKLQLFTIIYHLNLLSFPCGKQTIWEVFCVFGEKIKEKKFMLTFEFWEDYLNIAEIELWNRTSELTRF